ncbi:DAG7 [[Candida] subhashii]|uniref:DAG7 n=1 Tax=[Candida] subhashii TaxID=561895 RepID=A0A8J5V013_9ASCO|nr:DAG7 [[Candida] subhashii]KAG7665180.1 DAG7 [[Candida] subhashii]
MRLSTVALSSFLLSAISAAPALHTVYVTAYTTVLVNQQGQTITQAVAPVESTSSTSSSEDPVPTTSSTEEQVTTSSQPTTSAQPDTTTSSTEQATTSTVATASNASADPNAEETGVIYHGQGTYYAPAMGACGIVSQDTDYIIAISHTMFDAAMIDANPNHNPLCGKKIRAFYGDNSVEVTIVDRCVGCAVDDLDFSPTAFQAIADPALGRIDITWEWA